MKEGTFEYDTNNKDFLKHIDQHVTCELPEDDPELRKLVEDLQRHKCTHTCKKRGPDCRFGFPRLPSKETLITEPINKSDKNEVAEFKARKEILKKMTEYLESETSNEYATLDQILKDLNIKSEQYEKALKRSERGKQVVLKRKPSECRINNYNKRCLKVYQANMDIQFCLDAYAIVTYVCDYWSKDETGMTEFLKQALKEAKSLGNKEILSHLKRTYMSKRQIGKSEAIYRAIPSLHLQESNIACTFVQVTILKIQSNIF